MPKEPEKQVKPPAKPANKEEQKLRVLICEGFCSFYKPGNESMKCGTFEYLARARSEVEIARAAVGAPQSGDLSLDGEIKSLICEHCEFALDGCDFRAGLDSPPCGGYTLVEWMLKREQT